MNHDIERRVNMPHCIIIIRYGTRGVLVKGRQLHISWLLLLVTVIMPLYGHFCQSRPLASMGCAVMTFSQAAVFYTRWVGCLAVISQV